MDKAKFIETATSRETDVEVMQAIASIASSDSEADAIWDAPTDEQVQQIRSIVGDGDYCWGAAGSRW